MFQVSIQSINTVLERELNKINGENEFDKGEAYKQLTRFVTSLDKIRDALAPKLGSKTVDVPTSLPPLVVSGPAMAEISATIANPPEPNAKLKKAMKAVAS